MTTGVAATGRKPGFFDRLLNGMDAGVNAAFSGLDKAFATSDAKRRWRGLFPQLPVLEKLVGELNGQVLDGTAGPVSCSVYLSDNFFGFVIVHPNGAKTKVVFPYTDVINAQRGVYARVPMPHIVPQQNPAERSDSLLIFMRSGEIHMFTTFLHYNNLCAAFFALWNSALTTAGIQPSTLPAQAPVATAPVVAAPQPGLYPYPPTQPAAPAQSPQQLTPYPYHHQDPYSQPQQPVYMQVPPQGGAPATQASLYPQPDQVVYQPVPAPAPSQQAVYQPVPTPSQQAVYSPQQYPSP